MVSIQNGKGASELSKHTTEDAYPKMFPVNSIQASAPRCAPESVTEDRQEYWDAYVVGRRNLALVDRHNCAGCGRHYSVGNHVVDTHESSPTPNPEISLPKTMLGTPPVKVWIAPPIVKTTAPVNRVPLRPIASPMRPAASEVTVEHQGGVRRL
jgi:hypothetical protein